MYQLCMPKGGDLMVAHNFQKKANAKAEARRLRKKGLEATVFKKKKGYGVSSTRK